MHKIKLIECPRDAMQGLHDFIPTERKAEYINQLLKANFHTIDFGSFVSPKAIPQMRDTAGVLSMLDLSKSKSKLLAIVANLRGAEEAADFEQISYLGFPFSISETFQQRNTNSTIAESIQRVQDIQNLCVETNKELVIYISMAFGNPYGEKWDPETVLRWTRKMRDLGIKTIALSDTVGVSNPENIKKLFSAVVPELPEVEVGAHLHTTPASWQEKIEAALQSGCKRFDGAMHGYGGCPMAADDLIGNMPTEKMLHYFEEAGLSTGIQLEEFKKAEDLALKIMG